MKILSQKFFEYFFKKWNIFYRVARKTPEKAKKNFRKTREPPKLSSSPENEESGFFWVSLYKKLGKKFQDNDKNRKISIMEVPNIQNYANYCHLYDPSRKNALSAQMIVRHKRLRRVSAPRKSDRHERIFEADVRPIGGERRKPFGSRSEQGF